VRHEPAGWHQGRWQGISLQPWLKKKHENRGDRPLKLLSSASRLPSTSAAVSTACAKVEWVVDGRDPSVMRVTVE